MILLGFLGNRYICHVGRPLNLDFLNYVYATPIVLENLFPVDSVSKVADCYMAHVNFHICSSPTAYPGCLKAN